MEELVGFHSSKYVPLQASTNERNAKTKSTRTGKMNPKGNPKGIIQDTYTPVYVTQYRLQSQIQ